MLHDAGGNFTAVRPEKFKLKASEEAILDDAVGIVVGQQYTIRDVKRTSLLHKV